MKRIKSGKKSRFGYLKYMSVPFVLVFVGLMFLVYTFVWFIQEVADLISDVSSIISGDKVRVWFLDHYRERREEDEEKEKEE